LLSIKFTGFFNILSSWSCFRELNKIPQAISAYREAIALEPNLDAYNLGNLLQTGEFEQAEAIYRQAIAANPSHFGSYLNLGNLLMEQHQIEPAIQAYQTALALKPGEPDILNRNCLSSSKNPAQSLLVFCNKLYKQGI